MRRILVLFFALLLSSNVCFGKRAHIHSLTECIKQSPLIVVGNIKKIEYIERKTVLTVTIASVVKGTYAEKILMITGSYIVGYDKGVTKDTSPVLAIVGRHYIFFLNMKGEDQKHFSLFDETDGMIQWSYPVVKEITNQLKGDSNGDFDQVTSIGRELLLTLKLNPNDYKLIKLENMVSHGPAYIGPHIWRLTYKLEKIIPMGKGGEVFVEVDTATKKAKLLGYGE